MFLQRFFPSIRIEYLVTGEVELFAFLTRCPQVKLYVSPEIGPLDLVVLKCLDGILKSVCAFQCKLNVPVVVPLNGFAFVGARLDS